MTNSSNSNSDQVILATGGYDHTIKLWQLNSGVCQRTAQHTDSVSFFNRLKKEKRESYIYTRRN